MFSYIKRLPLRAILIVTILFTFGVARSQEPEDLFQGLVYSSIYEERIFNELRSGKNPSLIKMLCVTDPYITETSITEIEQGINNLIDDLRKNKLEKKTPQKTIKLIFQAVQETYFDKYDINANFPEMFSNGTFNCVTGSALYAIVLKELQIPFEIHSTEDHVYLISYPGTEDIIIESTDPLSGYYSTNNFNAADLLKQLRDQKLISQDEYESGDISSIMEMFPQYDTIVEMDALVGMQYYNKGVTQMDLMEFSAAVDHYRKAYLFYKLNDLRTIIQLCLAYDIILSLGEDQPFTAEVLDLILEYYKWSDQASMDEMGTLVIEGAQEYFRELLVLHDDPVQEDSIYRLLKATFTDSTSIVGLDYSHYIGLAEYYYKKFSPSESLEALDTCYRLWPDNLTIQQQIVTNAIDQIQNMTDIEKGLKRLYEYKKMYPFMDPNPEIKRFEAFIHTILASEYFRINNATKGRYHIQQFKMLDPDEEDSDINATGLSLAYCEMSAYYVRQGQYYKAVQVLKEGLKYAPRDEHMNRKLKVIEDYTAK